MSTSTLNVSRQPRGTQALRLCTATAVVFLISTFGFRWLMCCFIFNSFDQLKLMSSYVCIRHNHLERNISVRQLGLDFRNCRCSVGQILTLLLFIKLVSSGLSSSLIVSQIQKSLWCCSYNEINDQFLL